MDLIEVLWKQDVDMGFSLEEFQETSASTSLETVEEKPKLPALPEPKKVEDLVEDDLWAGFPYTVDEETGEYIPKQERRESEELSEDEPPSALLEESEFSLEEALHLVGFNEENFEGGEPQTAEKEPKTKKKEASESAESSEEDISLEDLISDMIQTPNYHHHHHHPPTPRPIQQGRMTYMRNVSSEQRWQELAGLLSIPPDHYHYHPPQANPYQHPPHQPPDKIANNHHHHVPQPTPDPYLGIHNGPGPGSMGSNNLGSAVASSMNLMTNNSEPMGGEATAQPFKMETPHDMMYYQNGNGTGEIGQNNSADGFLSSILNDEDLQLMDMAMNEGMYTMRMLEGTDSDSAVSSMGSERVPSLTSDTDWMETNSDSGHTPVDHFMTDYHSNKYRWYDYGYSRQHSAGDSAGGSNGGHRMPPVAQKKYQLFGKRMFQEQQNNQANSPTVPQQPNSSPPGGGGNSSTPSKFDQRGVDPPGGSNPGGGGLALIPPPLDMVKGHHPEIKYSCSIEFTRQNPGPGPRSSPVEAAIHNHTYHIPPEASGAQQRPLTRDKKIRKSDEGGGGGGGGGGGNVHLSRDERRARALSIPMTVDDIINLPMDEFNERLSKFDLSESQLSLIRDIRRRGKNKVAAQNCRKRKLDQIMSLADEVRQMREKKQRLLQERDQLLSERARVKTKFSQLYKHIFQSLRDSEGNAYSPYEWSLQQNADGSVVLLPRTGNQTMMDP